VWYGRLNHQFGNRVFRRERHVDDEYTAFARHIADAYLAAVRPYRLPSDREAEAKSGPIAAAAVAKYLKQIAFALRIPPHSSSVSMSNSPSLARALSTTCPPDGVFLKALCTRFITADARSCGSTSIDKAGSIGSTVNRMCRYSGAALRSRRFRR
jgi:hypothetical protein